MSVYKDIEILEALASKYSEDVSDGSQEVFSALQNGITILKLKKNDTFQNQSITDDEIGIAILFFKKNNVNPSYTRLTNFFLGGTIFKVSQINAHPFYGAYENNYTRKQLISICKDYLIRNGYTIYGKQKIDLNLN